MLATSVNQSRSALLLLFMRDALRWRLGAALEFPEIVVLATLAPADRFLGVDFAVKTAGCICEI